MLQAIDKISAPARKIERAAKRLGESTGRMAQRMGKAARPMDRLGSAATRLRGRLLAALVAVNRAAGPRGLDLLGRLSDKAGWAVGRLARKLGGLALSTAKWAGAAATAAGGFALFDMFRTASQFEQFQIMLENMEGSAAKAKRSMAWVREFAEKTPYELADVMQAFVQLKAYGIDPMDGSLRSLGDGAAGMAKPLMQAVEALADAQTGEFERLKEFGIRARTEGDKVTFTFLRNGKEISRQVRKNAADMKNAIVGIMAERFDGMMDRQSRTFAGMISNMKDQWSKFQMMVADAGIFDKVKAQLERLLQKVAQLAEDGTLERWAVQISKRLENAFEWAVEFAETTDWNAVGQDIKAIAGALGTVVRVLAKAVRLASDLQQRFENFVLPPHIGMMVKLGRNWLAGGYDRPDNKKDIETGRVKRPQRGPLTIDEWQRGMNRDKPGPLARPRTSLGRERDKVEVGGKAVIEVKVKGPASATLESVSKRGDLPWGLTLGRSMAGPA
ncbi:MAG: tape measure protein [Blastomonas sp.]